MRRLCTICARGGSKGVKGKNIRDLLGKPLIVHSIEQAKASGLFDLIAVSSDSDEILNIADNFGANILIERPIELASDHAAKLPAIQHCVSEAKKKSGLNFDVIVDLDATSPLRIVKDIKGAVELLEKQRVSNVITGSPARRSPYFNLVEIGENGAVKLSKSPKNIIVRRQDAPVCYDMNASIYVWWHDSLFKEGAIFQEDTQIFIMPEERSIDIDSELDFKLVEFLMRGRSSDQSS